MELSEVKNKEKLISEVSAITNRESKTSLTRESFEEISKVINEERTRLYEKKKMLKECEGKTPLEQAEIIAKYLANKKTN